MAASHTLFGRLLIVLLGLVQCGIVLACLFGLNSFRQRSWQRTVIVLASVAALIVNLQLQLQGYVWITRRARVFDDQVAAIALDIEALVCAFLVFFYAYKQRASSTRNSHIR
jgi:hypothetical protein